MLIYFFFGLGGIERAVKEAEQKCGAQSVQGDTSRTPFSAGESQVIESIYEKKKHRKVVLLLQ